MATEDGFEFEEVNWYTQTLSSVRNLESSKALATPNSSLTSHMISGKKFSINRMLVGGCRCHPSVSATESSIASR